MKIHHLKTIKSQTKRQLARRARELRNASVTDSDFDYWHKVMKEHDLSLKTGGKENENFVLPH